MSLRKGDWGLGIRDWGNGYQTKNYVRGNKVPPQVGSISNLEPVPSTQELMYPRIGGIHYE
ncbi:hypothetical protein [Scytonema sp. PCC 10023]|uniref:hypothetical protein n=1 Tax=Scytonema sp. PCC 10023 TaxID=1680591 RepID=UPI0039C641CD